MLKILKDKWFEHEGALKERISKIENIHSINYLDLVKFSFTYIFPVVDTDRITEIDDGEYQGTIIYMLPFDTYQPGAGEYLMTFVEYGSCSGCDTLEYIKSNSYTYDSCQPNVSQVTDLMHLCRDIVCNTIKPYNYGWRHDERFDHVEVVFD